MSTYILYCGSTTICLGDLPSYMAGFCAINYYEGFIRDCLDGAKTGNYHVLGNADTVLEMIKSQHKYIEAAGGLVVNNLGQSLVILRNGLFDLPKGKVEPGESIETAAVREVEEETGIDSPRINKKLLDTYHFYRWGTDPTICFKKTYWYLMDIDGAPQTNPQTEEGITACFWASDSEIASMVDKTHRNLKIIFNLKINRQL